LKVIRQNLGPRETEEALQIIRGKQAGMQLSVAIVGGGRACHNLLKILDDQRLSRLRMKILGVSDVDPEAPGFRFASELNLFSTTKLEELFGLPGLNLIIELTGSPKVREEVLKKKPPGVSFIDHMAARLLWDLVQIESEKTDLERERQRYEMRSRGQTQMILDSLPYRIMVVKLDKTIDTVNQTFLREFGLTGEEVLGKHCYEVRYALDRPCKEIGLPCFLEDRLQEIQKNGFYSAIKEYTDDNQKVRFDVITVAPILDEKGQIIRLVEASRDVTKRVGLEREVQESNTFFQNVIQSTVDGIVAVDTKGNVLIFNEGMERLTGYSAAETINKGHLSTFYNMDVAKENMRKMRSDQYGLPGKLNPTSMTITRKDGGEIPVTLSASIITIEGQEIGSVGVFTDMREILRMRKDLEEAHLQLVQSEKIASVGRMAAGVAHEINNPLSGILLYAELLKDGLKENRQQAEDIQEIIDQTLRCKKIVAELLEFSRQTIGKASYFSLERLITKALDLLINQAVFQNISVSMDIQPDMPDMAGDMGQMQQVFTNLFINSADAMQGRGKLRIHAHYDPNDSKFIIRISDTGPGIPLELRDQVFDMFFTTKPVGKGTGLGLSISQNIVSLHGGNITFTCPEAGGTTFTIELPREFLELSVEQPVFV
jgi:two-component system NtrC family sensor kinase